MKYQLSFTLDERTESVFEDFTTNNLSNVYLVTKSEHPIPYNSSFMYYEFYFIFFMTRNNKVYFDLFLFRVHLTVVV